MNPEIPTASHSETLIQFSRMVLAAATAYLFTVFLTPLVRTVAVRSGWLSKPVEDRWGKRVIARCGGVAMFGAFMASAVAWIPLGQAPIGLFIGSALIFALGLLDDLHRLFPYTKLIAQLLIGCVVVFSGIHIDLESWRWLSIPISVLWLVLIINAFNLLDNMDGLAAGVGALAAAFCAFHAAHSQQWVLVLLASILCGSCIGFLHFNFPPAKIFMGDSGSHFLGLSLAIMGLLGSWHHSTQLLSVLALPSLVLAVPIFDTCFVTIQRLLHRQHPFTGGTDHVSHRLAILGLSTRQTVLSLYAISACLGILSVITAGLKPLPALMSWLVVLSLLVLFGQYLARVKVYHIQREPIQTQQMAIGSSAATLIDTMLVHKRRLMEILVDFVLVSSAYVFAHLLRFEGLLTADLQRLIVQSLPILLVIKLVCFWSHGLYRGVWRYLSLSDLFSIFKAVTIGSIFSSLALLYLWRFEGYSRAVSIIDWLLCLFAVGGSRVVERVLDEWIHTAAVEQGVPILIIGAGDTGERVARYLKSEGNKKQRVIGFLDDDPIKQGSRIHGFTVLGTSSHLAGVLKSFRVRQVFIAIKDPPGNLLQHVQLCCEPDGIAWQVVTAGVTTAVG